MSLIINKTEHLNLIDKLQAAYLSCELSLHYLKVFETIGRNFFDNFPNHFLYHIDNFSSVIDSYNSTRSFFNLHLKNTYDELCNIDEQINIMQLKFLNYIDQEEQKLLKFFNIKI